MTIVTRPAQLPSGAPIEVLTEDEVDLLHDLGTRYTAQFAFKSVSDTSELDRLVGLELQAYRIGVWLARRRDYEDHTIDEATLQDKLKGLSVEIRQLKKLLGIDRITREKSRGEGSLPAYVTNLLARAKEFDIHRDHQRDLLLELGNQLTALVTAWRNMNDDERRELHYTTEDIFDWVLNVFLPEFQALDEHFRSTQQSTWIRTL